MKYDEDTIKTINFFERITKAKVKSLFHGDGLIFIVNDWDVGRAVGKGGSNIKKVSGLLKKKIKIVGFSENPEKFIANLILPAKGKIYIRGKKVIIEGRGPKFKEVVLGERRKNLEVYKEIVLRYFDYELDVDTKGKKWQIRAMV